MSQQRVTKRCRHDAAIGALEELHTKYLLNLLERLGDTRLRQI
jgi:hypothetical protein